MSKPVSKARKLIKTIQYGDNNQGLHPDLAFIGCVANNLLIEHTVIDVWRVKLSLLRRLISIANKIPEL